MKRGILKIIAMLTVLLVLAGCSVREVEVEPTMTPTATTTPAPEAEPALAICMNTLDHPVHRQVQLGFLDGCKELGYEDVSIIGAVDGDQKSQLDMALEWAKSVEGRPAAMLLWNGDHNSDELCEKLDEIGVYVGIPHFKIFVDDDDKGIEQKSGSVFDQVELSMGITFEMPLGAWRIGTKIAEHMAKSLDGKSGKIATVATVKSSTMNEKLMGFEERFAQLKKEGSYDLSGVKLLESRMEMGEKDVFVDILKENRDIIGMYIEVPESVNYLLEVCRERGIDPAQIYIATCDLTEKNMPLAEGSEVDLFANMPLYHEGYKCAENFDKLFKGEKVPKFEFLEAEYLTEETADELLPRYKELFERTKDDEFFERYKAREFIMR